MNTVLVDLGRININITVTYDSQLSQHACHSNINIYLVFIRCVLLEQNMIYYIYVYLKYIVNHLIKSDEIRDQCWIHIRLTYFVML